MAFREHTEINLCNLRPRTRACVPVCVRVFLNRQTNNVLAKGAFSKRGKHNAGVGQPTGLYGSPICVVSASGFLIGRGTEKGTDPKRLFDKAIRNQIIMQR